MTVHTGSGKTVNRPPDVARCRNSQPSASEASVRRRRRRVKVRNLEPEKCTHTYILIIDDIMPPGRSSRPTFNQRHRKSLLGMSNRH